MATQRLGGTLRPWKDQQLRHEIQCLRGSVIRSWAHRMCDNALGSSANLPTDIDAEMCIPDRMPNVRIITRRRLEKLLETTSLDATRLARLAGMAHTTITRFLNNSNYKSIPSTRTLAKLEDVAAAYIAARGGQVAPDPSGAGVPPAGRFVDDPDELRILDLFARIPRDRWSQVVRVIGALADDVAEHG